MSYDPIPGIVSAAFGDIGVGKGMLGLTTRVVPTSAGSILHTPGTFFSNFYSHYLVNINAPGDFVLAAIGSGGVDVGHLLEIDAIDVGGGIMMRILDSSLTQIAAIESGWKVFLEAFSGGWKVSYSLPKGRDNWLIVYDGAEPRVALLPIKKEFDYNGDFEYGIKSIESFDYTNAYNITDFTNTDKIIFEGSRSTTATLDSAPDAIHTTIACDKTYYVPSGSSISFMAGCWENSYLDNIGDSKGLALLGSQRSYFYMPGSGTIFNSSILSSADSSIRGDGSTEINTSTIIASSGSSITNVAAITNSSIISSSSATMDGCNSCAGIANAGGSITRSVLSSNNSSTACTITDSTECVVSGSESSTIGSSLSSSFSNTTSSTIDSCNYSSVRDSNRVDIKSENAMIVENSDTVTSDNNVRTLVNTSKNISLSSNSGCCVINNEDSSIGKNLNCSSVSLLGGNFSNGYLSGVYNTAYDEINSVTCTTVGASTACILTGNGDNSYDPGRGFLNTCAGVSVLSSHNIKPDFNAGDYRYLVMGGYNVNTWSINSKEGVYYGDAFVPGQALPGFSEMFPNFEKGTIPEGRLLQIENGCVRLCRPHEKGFMISRNFETAAFVAGNPTIWHKLFLTDEFGRKLTQTYDRESYSALMSKLGRTEDDIKLLRIPEDYSTEYYIINPEYNYTIPYVPRSERTGEWTCCEKTGIVIIEISDRTTQPGDFIESGESGIGVISSKRTNIVVLEVINERFVKVDISNQYLPDEFKFDASIDKELIVGMPEMSLRDLTITDSTIVVRRNSIVKIKVEFITDSTPFMSLIGDSIFYPDYKTKRRKNDSIVTAVFKESLAPGVYRFNLETSLSGNVTVEITT